MKIGVVGVGFVGKAVKQCFSFKHEVVGYDTAIEEYKDNWEAILDCNVCFVCVPTPTIAGRQNLAALDDVLTKLDADKYTGIVVVKCTVVPGTMARYAKLKRNLTLVHNPEFLTAVSSFADFVSQKTVLISCRIHSAALRVYEVYKSVLPNVAVIYNDDFATTELAKYLSNTFLASKVTFMNEFYNLCRVSGANFDDVVTMAVSQGLVAPNHCRVPGPDTKFGYGGACFPKDVKALLYYSAENGHNFTMLSQTDRTNDRIRGDK